MFLHILQNSKGSRIGAKHGVVKATPSLPPPRSCCLLFARKIHIVHKIHQNYYEAIFWVDPKNLSTHKYVPSSSLGDSFPLLSLQSGNKNVNKGQYLGISAFHIPLRVQIKYSNKQNKYGEHNFNLNFTQCWLNVDNSR